MTMLQNMANPTSTNNLSSFEANTAQNKAGMQYGTAQDISSAYMDAAGTGLNAQMAARQIGLDTMRTGAEGTELMAFLNPGTAGAQYALAGVDQGTAGSPYRMQAQDYRTNAAGNAAGVITGNMPTGITAANYQMQGAEAKNAAMSDLAGGAANLYSSYLQYGPNANKTPTYMNQPAYFPYTTSSSRVA
jgi:hypothetical protein